MYNHETLRQLIIDRINAACTTMEVLYRSPVPEYSGYPALVLEYGENENLWESTHSDKREYAFNLYVVYDHEETEASRNEAEENISNVLGELYNTVFSDPGILGLANGWMRASNTSWGYIGTPDVPMRTAMIQLRVTVHEDRA